MYVIIVIVSAIMIRFLVMINIATTIHGIVKHKLFDHNFIKYWTNKVLDEIIPYSKLHIKYRCLAL